MQLLEYVIPILSLLVPASPSVAETSGVVPNPASSVSLLNITTTSKACDGKFLVTKTDTNETHIIFDGVSVTRGDEKPFIRCRLRGEINVPVGFKTRGGLKITSTILGGFDQIGDQAGGRLSVRIEDNRESKVVLVKNQEIEDGRQITLETSLPEIGSHAAGHTVTVTLYFEGMINYQLDRPSNVTASLEKIIIPPIELIPLSDPPITTLSCGKGGKRVAETKK